MNGDVLCNLDYRRFFEEHVRRKNKISVSSYKRENRIDFGVIQFDKDHYLADFQEKPVYRFDVSMGVYCIHKSVVEKLPKGEKYGFDDLMLDGIRNKQPIWIHPFEGFWLDIGRPEDYQYAEEHYQEIKKL